MDRKTEYDFAKTVLMLERMGLKEAAERLEQEMTENEEETVEEAEKPDFLDLDKDGDKEESMKDAAEDKEEKELDEEVENLEEKHDCEKAHPGQTHEEYTAQKNESMSLKGMTKAELTEAIKEMIRKKINK